MSDLAEQAGIATTRNEDSKSAAAVGADVYEGDAAATRFGHFAQRVLPTLRQLRAARRAAEVLAMAPVSPALERIAGFALESIRSIDTTLRLTGVYDLSELAALESDAERMNGVCRVLDEVAARLRALAREISQQTAPLEEAAASTALADLLALLNAPLRFEPDGEDSAASR